MDKAEVKVSRTGLGLCNGGLADVGRKRPRGSHHCQGASQTRLQVEIKPQVSEGSAINLVGDESSLEGEMEDAVINIRMTGDL